MTGRRDPSLTPNGPEHAAKPKVLSLGEVLILILAVLWALSIILGTGLTDVGGFGLDGILRLGTLLLPIFLFLFCVVLLRSLRLLRHEHQMLQSFFSQQNVATPLVEDPPEPVAEYPAPKVPTFMSRRGGAQNPTNNDPQPGLALGLDHVIAPQDIAISDLIRALHFPNDADDAAGFAALRRALADRSSRKTIQAAQDVLTLLAQDGIYVEDLTPDQARPDLWRRFAMGERSAVMGELGAVRDRTALALCAARMRQDMEFREKSHLFLQHFDHLLQGFETRASDADIAAFTRTRSAIAFMLIGRVAGVFD